MGWSRSILLAVPPLVVLAATCVRSNSEQCGEVICPDTLACVNTVCVDKNLVSACDGQPQGATCQVQDQGSGTCDQFGVCQVGFCGDGKIEGDKQCDGNNLDGKTCLDFGATTMGGLKCNSMCEFDTSGCNDACGNGQLSATKPCDGSNFGGKTCQDYWFYAGSLLCTSTCSLNFANCNGRCGDGVVNGFEQCDGTSLGSGGNESCASIGYCGQVVPLACGSDCAFTADSCTCGGGYCNKLTETCVGGSGGIGMCVTNNTGACTP